MLGVATHMTAAQSLLRIEQSQDILNLQLNPFDSSKLCKRSLSRCRGVVEGNGKENGNYFSITEHLKLHPETKASGTDA